MKKLLYISVLFFTISLQGFGQRYRTTVVKSICNSNDWELCPVLYQNGLVFLSNRTVPSTKKYINDDQGIPLNHIYYAEFDADGDPVKARKFSNQIETTADDGPIAFAQDDRMLVVCLQNGYAGQSLPKNGFSGLYFSYNDGTSWSAPEPYEFNDPAYNFSSPFLTSDGLTLYFSANNMDDSYGGWDLYVSEYDGRRWSEPRNLGANINTPEWEVFPYIHSGERLYFSSRGHGARGGSFDLFFSTKYDEEWTEAVPVPSLNTYDDELSIIISDDYSNGYIARKTGDDFDIYRFQYPNYETFTNPRPIQRQSFCFRLRENSLDTIDYSIFSYDWVINDTLTIPGHDIKLCFPGPGDYHIAFNVTNKLIDTVMYDVATYNLNLQLIEQPVINAPDTVQVGQTIIFSAKDSYWNRWDIEGYYWDFGTGVQDKGQEVRYQYMHPGNYTVILGIKEKVRNRRFEPEKAAVYKDIVVLPSQ